jgi:FkbM family methyltransferase
MFQSRYDGFVYTHNDPIFHNSIQNGQSEPYPRDLAIVKKYLKMFPHKNRDFIDVGGHIGTTAMPFLKEFSTCVAYEPTVANFNFLVQNIQQNGMTDRCIPKNVGCSDKVRVGRTQMHGGGNSGCFYFTETNAPDGATDTITTVRIDDDPDVATRNIDFLKIDTEGHELFVLKGAERTLLRCKPLIQVETNGLSDRYFGISKQDIFNYLYSLGAREFDTTDGANTYFYFPNISLAVEPRTIFCLWTGTNPMSDTRRQCLSTIKNVRLITHENLNDYILSSEPLHPAYKYLSETHKADYLRTYLMNFYGGGYADIKTQTGEWDIGFEKMQSGEYIACGYRESCPADIAHPDYTQFWNELIGNGAYIMAPYTEFTKAWYKCMLDYLDSIYPRLVQHPARNPQDCLERGGGYPIGWNHMLGRIFHPLVYRYRAQITYDLPTPSFVNYR